MDLSGLSSDFFRLDAMAEHYGVDVCCISWQTTDGLWARVTNMQQLASAEQMDSSKLHKVLFRRSAPLFYEDMTKQKDIRDDILVVEPPNFRFYAEAPLLDERGKIFGSISIANREPKSCRDMDFPPVDRINEFRAMAMRLSLEAASAKPSVAVRTFTLCSERSESSGYPQATHRASTMDSDAEACVSLRRQTSAQTSHSGEHATSTVPAISAPYKAELRHDS